MALITASTPLSYADPDAGGESGADLVATSAADDGDLPGRFVIGVGFMPDDGFIGSAAVENRNLFGRGQHLSLSTRISQRRQLFDIQFAEPHLFDTDTGLSMVVFNRRIEWPGFSRQGIGGALTLSRPLSSNTRAYLSYRAERVDLDTHADTGRALIEPGGFDPALLARDHFLSSVRAGVEYDSRDSRLLPVRGSFAGAWIERADPRLGSDVDLFRARAWAEHHQPIGPLTLHLSGGLGLVTSRSSLGVPLSERLQLNGSRDLRGFGLAALGPVDMSSGIPLGGNLRATARAELEVPLVPKWGISALVFADAAHIADLEDRYGSGTGLSVGGGLLWRSPLGPLGFTVAQPMDGSEPVFLFTLGGNF